MALKNEIPSTRWRCELLNFLLDHNYSENTMLTISGAIKVSENKEELAKNILDAVSNETEDEIIRAKAIEVINR